MKLMRLAMWVAIFAIVGGSVYAGDMDVQALQAKLAAQEARLNDLQAKMGSGGGGAPAGVLTARKNATLTIGGYTNLRYMYNGGTFTRTDGTQMKMDAVDFSVRDAALNFNFSVNEHFDAMIRLNMRDGNRGSDNDRWRGAYDGAGNTVSAVQYAWLRWKNICNTGFGILIGRSELVFGSGNPGGMYEQGWDKNNAFWGDGSVANQLGARARVWGTVAGRAFWDSNRTTQLTPYWEAPNRKFRIELSLFQDQSVFDGGRYIDNRDPNKVVSQNWGQSMSTRMRYTPIEGLNLWGSFINRVATHGDPLYGGARANGKQSLTALNLGVDWTPCFLPRLKVFTNWTHTWNANFERSSVDVFHAGFRYGITEQLAFVLQGDYMYGRVSSGALGRDGLPLATPTGDVYAGDSLRGWAIYPAMRYTLPYNAWVEVGYRHDSLREKRTAGQAGAKLKTNTVYGHVGFDF